MPIRGKPERSRLRFGYKRSIPGTKPQRRTVKFTLLSWGDNTETSKDFGIYLFVFYMKDRLAKSIYWLVWSRGVMQGISFLSTLIVARLLSPEDYGLMALATVWISSLVLLSEMGLGAAIIQFPDISNQELNACFWLMIGIAGVGYFTLYISAPAISRWFAIPALVDVLRCIGLILPFVALRVVPDSLLRKRLELDKIAQREMLSTVATLPIIITLAWYGAGIWALVAGTVTASCV